MSKWWRPTKYLLLVCALLGACSASGASTVETRSGEALAAAWWTWAASEPTATNPVVDDTGADCARNQPDDVWFLAGTFGGVAQRACSVPEGRDLFLPILNVFCSPGDGCESWLDDAEMVVMFDGQPIVPVEIDTPPVEIDGAEGNPVTGGAGTLTAVVAGWWVRIPAPEPGPHVLEFAGASGGFSLDVRYDLEVG